MTIYCIDDGGDGSQTNTTQSASTLDWSKADASVADLISYDAAAFTTAGNIIYFGDDHNDPNKAAHWTLTCPTTAPVILISADRTNSTPTYKKGTGDQLSSLGGAYTLTLDKSFAIYGLRMASGSHIAVGSNTVTQRAYTDGCTFVPAANGYVQIAKFAFNMVAQHDNVTIDLTADGTTDRTGTVLTDSRSNLEVRGLSFVNAGYRTGVVYTANGGTSGGPARIHGADFSGFTNGAACELIYPGDNTHVVFSNCLTAATWTLPATTPSADGQGVFAYNVGPADAPTALQHVHMLGTLVSSASIYRTGGAAVEGDACSWLITTTASCAESRAFYTPWIYGTVSSTGSKTFDLYIINDTADFTDAEVWLEIQYLSTADKAIWALATDHRTITATAAAQTDDTTSDWNGTGPSFTYKQCLSVTATIGETGQFRARVAVGKASIAGSRYFYVDPKITVS